MGGGKPPPRGRRLGRKEESKKGRKEEGKEGGKEDQKKGGKVLHARPGGSADMPKLDTKQTYVREVFERLEASISD